MILTAKFSLTKNMTLNKCTLSESTKILGNFTKANCFNREAVEIAKNAKKFGIILGTLGRQGSPRILTVRLKKIHKKF